MVSGNCSPVKSLTPRPRSPTNAEEKTPKLYTKHRYRHQTPENLEAVTPLHWSNYETTVTGTSTVGCIQSRRLSEIEEEAKPKGIDEFLVTNTGQRTDRVE